MTLCSRGRSVLVLTLVFGLVTASIIKPAPPDVRAAAEYSHCISFGTGGICVHRGTGLQTSDRGHRRVVAVADQKRPPMLCPLRGSRTANLNVNVRARYRFRFVPLRVNMIARRREGR